MNQRAPVKAVTCAMPPTTLRNAAPRELRCRHVTPVYLRMSRTGDTQCGLSRTATSCGNTSRTSRMSRAGMPSLCRLPEDFRSPSEPKSTAREKHTGRRICDYRCLRHRAMRKQKPMTMRTMQAIT